MDRPITEAPQTHIYFITHGSGTFTVLRLRAVNAAELASLSIVDRTTAPRSTVIVASLILSRSTYLPAFTTEAAVECARGSGRVRKLVRMSLPDGFYFHAGFVVYRRVVPRLYAWSAFSP